MTRLVMQPHQSGKTEAMRAATYTPSNRMGWWGGPDTRLRCCGCDKVVFPNQAAAEGSAAKVREREAPRKDRKVMQAYLGKCGHWHVGHGRPSARSGCDV